MSGTGLMNLQLLSFRGKDGQYLDAAFLRPGGNSQQAGKNNDFNKFFAKALKSMGMGDLAKSLGLGGKSGQGSEQLAGNRSTASSSAANAAAYAGPNGASAAASAASSSSSGYQYNYNYTFGPDGQITSWNGSGSGWGSGENSMMSGSSSIA